MLFELSSSPQAWHARSERAALGSCCGPDLMNTRADVAEGLEQRFRTASYRFRQSRGAREGILPPPAAPVIRSPHPRRRAKVG